MGFENKSCPESKLTIVTDTKPRKRSRGSNFPDKVTHKMAIKKERKTKGYDFFLSPWSIFPLE